MGKLYIIPTPIGNLEDMTYRAVRILSEVAFVYAEDTRVSKRLLNHYNIQTNLRSYHAFNEHQKTEELITLLQAGSDIAIISDAGTPGISDPSYLAVKAAIDAGIKIECLPGATAFVPALVLSGLPNHKFAFYGFPPHKKGRKKFLEEAASEDKTVVLYESPYRLLKLLEELSKIAGENRNAAVVREISKLYEETVRGTLADLSAHFKSRSIKGEFVVVMEGALNKL